MEPVGNRKEEELLRGLTAAEAEERVQSGRVNGDETVRTKTFGQILFTNLVTPFNILNLILAVLILLVHSPRNALFMGVIVCNAVIGTVQEIRAKKLIDRLSLIAAPKAHVIRDGRTLEIPVSGIVLDDLMELKAGMQVCADCRLLSGEPEVDESMITGESDPVEKEPGGELLSGSFIVSGSCLARVIRVGGDNYAAKITKQAKYLKRPASEIMISVNRLIKAIGFLLIPVGTALFIKQHLFLGQDIRKAVVSTVAALVGMIPEGLVLLTSVVLAVSVIRLGRRQALVQELYSIEMLARVDVLCLDKTGTITEGRMQVRAWEPLSGHTEEELQRKACGLVQAIGDTNPTARAVLESGAAPAAWTVIRTIPFSSARKFSAVFTEEAGALYLGAPGYVAKNTLPEETAAQIGAVAAQGERVLLLAQTGDVTAEHPEDDAEVIGFVRITDVIRSSAPETLAYFKEQGVELKVISGDAPETVSAIAARAGLSGAENYVDATTLAGEAETKAAASRYTVFGRVKPEQKLWLIQALKAEGHTVAMTGDGVNDVMALRESDCSIAMAAGSDAARNVSQIVLLNSDFASMPHIVAEGRRSINNLQRSAALFLTKTGFSTLIALIFLFLAAPYPLQPIQFTLISGLTIGIPSFVLALEPNRELVRGHFLPNVLRKALPGSFTDVTAVVLLTVLSLSAELPHAEMSSMSTLAVAFVGFLVLFKVCVPFDRNRICLFAGLIVLFVLAAVLFGGFFGIRPIHWEMFKVLIIIAGVSVGAYLLFLLLFEKILGRWFSGGASPRKKP